MLVKDVTIEWLKERLEGWEGSGGQYYCWCPCHDDVGSAMKGGSITEKPGGKILYKCHSPHCGATLTRVVAVLIGDASNGVPEVRVRKTQQDGAKRTTKGKGGLKDWAEYTQVSIDIWKDLGVEEHGAGIAFTYADTDIRKIRMPEKQIHFEPKGKGISPLWPIPNGNMPRHISITEGESDCGTTYAAGLPQGHSVTKGSDTPLSVETFLALAQQGVQEITFFADADNSGDELRSRVVALAVEAGLTVNVCDLRIITLPWYPKKDINELWKETDEEEFLELIERATYQVAHTRPALTVAEILEAAAKDIDWIIPDLIARDEKVLIWGPPKAFKTYIGLDLIRALCTGQPFLNRSEWRATHPQNVMLVEEEGNLIKFARRVAKLGLEDSDNFFLKFKTGFRFTEPDKVSELIANCRELEIDVLFLDPIQRMIPGINENDANETGVVWDEVARIQQQCPGMSVVLTHHAGKSDHNSWFGSRGSSRHGGEADVGMSLQRDEMEENVVNIWMDGRDVHAELKPDESFRCKITINDDTFIADATDVTVTVRKGSREQQRDQNEHAVYAAVLGGADTRTKIMRATNLSDATVRKHLVKLAEQKLIIETDNGEGRPKTYTEGEESE